MAATAAGSGIINRGMITATVMLATLMQALDTTIANVALPYMQGSLSATSDQINWVLTSYIVAAAIITPATGWLEARFGRKPLFLTAVIGFVVTSMLCGAAVSLAQIVVFRLLQGIFGAPLVPLSQAVLLDAYPPEQKGQATALFGLGVMSIAGMAFVAALIAAGADMNLTNGSGMTPLGMALLMHHPDSAEVLVSKGARLTASQAQMLNASVTDPRSKAIIQRAAGK